MPDGYLYYCVLGIIYFRVFRNTVQFFLNSPNFYKAEFSYQILMSKTKYTNKFCSLLWIGWCSWTSQNRCMKASLLRWNTVPLLRGHAGVISLRADGFHWRKYLTLYLKLINCMSSPFVWNEELAQCWVHFHERPPDRCWVKHLLSSISSIWWCQSFVKNTLLASFSFMECGDLAPVLKEAPKSGCTMLLSSHLQPPRFPSDFSVPGKATGRTFFWPESRGSQENHRRAGS